jgi:hypothetical protein
MRRGNLANLHKALWTDVDDGMLIYMWVELGQSMSEIGRVLKRSRNGVAGRIMRLKITRTGLASRKVQA